MGGLKVIPNYPAPKYVFEMMAKSPDDSGNSTLFLHFEVSSALAQSYRHLSINIVS